MGTQRKKRLSPGLEDGLLNNLMHIYVYMYDYERNREQGAPYYSPVSSFFGRQEPAPKRNLGGVKCLCGALDELVIAGALCLDLVVELFDALP